MIGGIPDLDELPQMLYDERKRQRLSLRRAGAVIGILWDVLARAEHGKPPDVANYFKIVRWLWRCALTLEPTRDDGCSE